MVCDKQISDNERVEAPESQNEEVGDVKDCISFCNVS